MLPSTWKMSYLCSRDASHTAFDPSEGIDRVLQGGSTVGSLAPTAYFGRLCWIAIRRRRFEKAIRYCNHYHVRGVRLPVELVERQAAGRVATSIYFLSFMQTESCQHCQVCLKDLFRPNNGGAMHSRHTHTHRGRAACCPL